MSRQDRFAVECLAARRATWMEINLQALAGNLRVLKEVCRNRPIWAVVKADAYGHGAVACSRTLAEAGVHGLVVALPEEGVALRRAGITLPILLTGALPTDGAESLVRHDIAPAISAVEELEALSAGACASGRQASFHLEIDTGMTRMGVAPAE
ncbi:MAG: alanine racemase, partial [Acidobacteriota bacterium]